MDTKSLFDICIEICKKEFFKRKWWEENLPYDCVRELCMRREWYNESSGQIYSEGEYREGKKEGIHRQWYNNGSLLIEGKYRDNKKEGIHRTWSLNGQLRYDGEYKNGKEFLYKIHKEIRKKF